MWTKHVAVLAFLLVSTAASQASDWVSEARSACTDPLLLRNSSLDGSLLPPNPVYSVVNNTVGDRQYVTFSQKAVAGGSLIVGRKFLTAQSDLSVDQRTALKKLITAQASSRKIPWYLTIFIPSPAVFELFFLNKLAEGSQAFLFDKLSDSAVTLDALAMVIADGGQLIRSGMISENKLMKGQFAFVDMTEYTIQLGKERRTFLLGACTYPARPRITKMTLTYKSGAIDTFSEKDETNWMEVGNAGTMPLKKFAEDDQFVYFQELCNLDDFCVRHRIDKSSGAFGTAFEQQDPVTKRRFYPPNYDSTDMPDIIKIVSE
jgi:hypothetical protein